MIGSASTGDFKVLAPRLRIWGSGVNLFGRAIARVAVVPSSSTLLRSDVVTSAIGKHEMEVSTCIYRPANSRAQNRTKECYS